MNLIKINPAEKKDLPHIVNLHISGIETGFITSLGFPFLVEFYKFMITSSQGVLLAAKDPSGEIAGFISGTFDVAGYYREFICRPGILKTSALATVGIIRKPNQKKGKGVSIVRKAISLFETLSYPLRVDTSKNLPKAELLSIVVSENMRGKANVATMLFNSLAKEFREKKKSRFKTVVSSNNARGCAYYEKNGGVPAAEIEVHKGNVSKVYVWNLN